MVEWFSLVVSVVALTVSGLLAVREARAAPDLHLYLNWVTGGPAPWSFRIVVENRGRARGTVRNVLLSTSERFDKDTAMEFLPHLEVLPEMLEPGDVLRLAIPLDPNLDSTTLSKGLLEGGYTHVILIDQRDTPRAFTIPPMPTTGETRRSLAGRVAKR